MTTAIHRHLLLMTALALMAGCRSDAGTIAREKWSDDKSLHYWETQRNDRIIARYVDHLGDDGALHSRLYLDENLQVLYYDTFSNGHLACRYRADGSVWMDNNNDHPSDAVTDPWSTDWRARERLTGDRIVSMVLFAQAVRSAATLTEMAIQRNL